MKASPARKSRLKLETRNQKLESKNHILSFGAVVGVWPTQRPKCYKRRRPRASGDPRPLDSRFRGNDVTFDGEAKKLSS